ncbi:MAG: spermine synthase [Elusimicrobiota bacterium]|nr:spermine synthase [Elusimicrobiota bacterium]
MANSFLAIILITGFSGIVAQVLLLRELLVSFYGNELSIGIILANWLLLEGIGSFVVGKKIENIKDKFVAFVSVCIIFSISFPVTIYFARILKLLLGAQFGEGVGIFSIFYSTFALLTPVCVTHGALFTFGCKLYDEGRPRTLEAEDKEGAESISKVYIYETIGTVIGGLVITYLLIPYFNSFQIAVFVALVNFFCSCLLAAKSGKFFTSPLRAASSPSGRIRAGFVRKILTTTSILLLLVSLYFLFSSRIESFHQLSIANQWKGHNVIHYQNSIYGNVSVVKEGEQYTFFSDGIPVVTVPVPDIAFIEDFVHLPMLTHTDPKNVLIISGGAGGVISEILKYNSVERIDYVELDPLILEVVKKFPTVLTSKELANPKVKIHYTDGRYFTKTTDLKYDIVFLGISDMQDLQSNRLFTIEFFDIIKSKLTSTGMVVINLPGSLTYLSEELKKLNLCVITTLKNIFTYIKIIPGDSNLFLCSNSKEIVEISPALLYSRLTHRKIITQLLTLPYIEYRLHSRWVDWFLESLQTTKAGINHVMNNSDHQIGQDAIPMTRSSKVVNYDFKPLGMFFSISYWNAKFSPYLQKFFRAIEEMNLWLPIASIGIFTMLILIVHFTHLYTLHHFAIPYLIATTGFVGMIFQLVLIFGFQVLYGYLYHQIGLLITAFMVGIVIGSILSARFLNRIRNHITALLRIELTIILFSGILVLILNLLKYSSQPVVFSTLPVLFLLLCFISGFLVGAEFPLGNKVYLQNTQNISATAGLLYASDLFGGWIAGIVSSVVFLPVLGLAQTCLIAMVLKVTSTVIFALQLIRIKK